MTGDWAWAEEGEDKFPPTNNNILGTLVARLRKLVQPPQTAEPPFPHFSLKACVLGKLCSGKTSCLAKIAQGIQKQCLVQQMNKPFSFTVSYFPSLVHGVHILSAPALVNEAITAFNNKETVNKIICRYFLFIKWELLRIFLTHDFILTIMISLQSFFVCCRPQSSMNN